MNHGGWGYIVAPVDAGRVRTVIEFKCSSILMGKCMIMF